MGASRVGLAALTAFFVVGFLHESQADCTHGEFSAGDDCNLYNLCSNGELVEFHCPSGLYWNQAEKACSGDPTAGCGAAAGTDDNEAAAGPQPAVEEQDLDGSGTQWDFKVVCYFTNWAWYRPGLGRYTPDNIDPELCTHIVYGFATLDYSTLTMSVYDSWADLDNKFYEKVVAYKKKGIKVTIAIGGWNDSAGDKYSRMVRDSAARKRFVDAAVQFVDKYGFDGLDLDWEYPKCWQTNCDSGPAADKEGFAKLVVELHDAFKPKGLLLSAAVSPNMRVVDNGYDVPTLSKYLDWIGVMAYDYHGSYDGQTGLVAPMNYYPGDLLADFNVNFSVNYWLQNGADSRKLVMGAPAYGRSFSLSDVNQHGLNVKTYGTGNAGEFTREAGVLSYYEICNTVKTQSWNVVHFPDMGSYAYAGNQWVGYDDVEDFRLKSQFIKDKRLGGGMIWALDYDDFSNRCGCGTYPLLKTMNAVLRQKPFTTNNCT